MLHHEESPEKPQYMATPHFALLPFSGKNFRTPTFPSILKKSNAPPPLPPPPPLHEGESSNYENMLANVDL